MRQRQKIAAVAATAVMFAVGCSGLPWQETDSPVSSPSSAAETVSWAETASWEGEEESALAEDNGKESADPGAETAPAGGETEPPDGSADVSDEETGGNGETSVEAPAADGGSDQESSVYAGLETEAVIGTLAEATGYNWSDVYIVIMNTVLTKPDAHTGTPSFALLPWNDREEPVLIVGYWQDPNAEEYTIYSFSGDTLIEVEHLTGSLSISERERRILCEKPDGSRALYQYGEDHLVKLSADAYSTEGFMPVAFTSLTDHTITDENIRDYIAAR